MRRSPPRRSVDVDYARPLAQSTIESGLYRDRVGGLWDELGELQLRFLIAQGLRPEHRLLDMGCGALRGGVRFVEYLDPGHYFGVDVNQSLLEAGYERELDDALRAKLPRENLRVSDRFQCNFGVRFDFAIAQSLFTHLSFNQIRLCLFRVARNTSPGGRFFATYFEVPPSHRLDRPLSGGRLWTERNVFFYYRRDLDYAAGTLPWRVRHMGDWGHPRGQVMVEFRRRHPSGLRPRLGRAARRLGIRT